MKAGAIKQRMATFAVALALSPVAATAAQERSDWPSSITIGTASEGGTYLVYGTGLAQLIETELGLSAAAEATEGPVENLGLLQSGEIAMAMVTMGPAHDAWLGENELAPGEEMRELRALFPMYESPFHIMALESSGLAKASQLDGQRVGVGPPEGTPGTYFPRYFQQLGLDVEPRFGVVDDLAQELEAGSIDAFALAIGAPIAAFAQLEAEQPVTFFAFDAQQREQLLRDNPSLAPYTLAAGTYQSLEQDLPTVSMWSFVVADKDLPVSLAYEITRLVLEDNERMRAIHPSAAQSRIENWSGNSVLPFHAGAVRYFLEQGIDLPSERIPEEYSD